MNTHQTILKGIKEQLFLNDYLVIPNFGGFILKKSSAHFSSSGTLILPPSKSVSFNVQLKQNDGLFVQWLQNEMKCEAKEALSHLHDFAEYCRSLLQTRGRLTIEGIGFFYLDFENNICFEPQQQTNFLSSSFGLTPVSLKELDIEVPVKNETVFIDRKSDVIAPVKTEETFKRRNYRKMAAVAVSGAILFSTLVIIISNNKITGRLKASLLGKETKTFYSPLNYSDIQLSELSIAKKDYVADANGIAAIELDNKTIAVKAMEIEASTTKVVKHSSSYAAKVNFSNKNFEVVLGCFSILNNAHKMVSKLSDKQIRAAVTGQNEKGLYVVSGGGYDTKEEAMAQLNELKTAFPNAWIRKAGN
ncbi:MAG: hypothetical protein K0S12_435 [Bacteroidetes bacterium]|nr:hypothetical protein [Bacteroidota bacterium]